MNNSREDSPDWLRSFQAPTSTLTLSSDSNSSPNGSPRRVDKTDADDEDTLEKRNHDKVNQKPSGKKENDAFKDSEGSEEDGKVAAEEMSEKHLGSHAVNHSIWTLSSDSESSPGHSPQGKQKVSLSQESGEASDPVLTGRANRSPLKKTSKGKSPKKGVKARGQTPKKEKNVKDDAKITENDVNVETAEEEASEKHIEPHVSTSRLPLVLSEKVHRSKALVECEGDSIDLSGDMGAVGRIVVSGSASENHEMFLDLKGTIYKTTIVPCRTFCIVSFGQTEAKIEAIMNDFIQLKPQSNVYEAETMVEGTLEGFSFDSEDEAEKIPKAIPHQTDQNEDIDGQMNGKSKGRADKTSMVSRKRGKTGGGKSQPAKKARKKAISKKPKAKK
ncbi:DNA-binding protein BIN4 [Gossypium arboreum]|uniref:DNA-binding protein BIN4 n=1 Tax=Gossypium arboreum TaxID=29729 RepID=UPI000818F918|nr:DNA-binding protein BIN4 [Gossypium arboreum]